MFGKLGVEEVVGVTVYREDRMTGLGVASSGGSAAGESRDDIALAVGIEPERDRALPITGKNVGHPAGHEVSLERSEGWWRLYPSR